MHPTGAGVAHGILAERLRASHDEILACYERRLETANSPLVADPDTRAQVLDQASSIVSDLCATLRDVAPADDVSGLLLSRRIGASRAARRDHPSESLLAAAQLIRSVNEVARGLDPPVDPQTLLDMCTVLTDGVFGRLREAAGVYAGYLLDEIRLSADQERARIARELHDRVGFSLSAALRQLEIAEVGLETDPSRAGGAVHHTIDLVTDAIDSTRRLLAGLRLQTPAGSLGRSLREQIEPFTDEVKIEINSSGDESWLPAETRAEAFLVLREAVRNALRHGRPGAVIIDIDVTPSELRAVVQDDGAGFTVSPDGAGTGLRSMHERARAAGGHLRVSSRPLVGTRVELTMPVRPPDDAERGQTL
jgi:signal transduction histidine kinase